MYAEVDVVVDGAAMDREIINDEEFLDNYIEGIRQEAFVNRLHYEVFILWHMHADSVTICFCEQAITDHHPNYEWNSHV